MSTKKFTSPYQMFATDTAKEAQEGVVLNYSDAFWIRIARAGGSNDKYKRILLEKLKPFRRAIQTETMDEKVSARLLREAVAEGIVLEWGTGRHPEGAGFIPGPDGEPMAFTLENILKVFEDLPDLFQDVYDNASKQVLFRAAEIEADGGN